MSTLRQPARHALSLRRPVWLTLPLGLALGALAGAGIFPAVAGLVLGMPDGALDYTAAALRFGAVASAAAALLVGAPWFLASRAVSRRRRLRVVLETAIIATGVGALLNFSLAVAMAATAGSVDLGRQMLAVLALTLLGGLLALGPGLTAGVVWSLVGFERCATPQPAPPPATP